MPPTPDAPENRPETAEIIAETTVVPTDHSNEWPEQTTPKLASRANRARARAKREGETALSDDERNFLEEYTRRYTNAPADDPLGLRAKRAGRRKPARRQLTAGDESPAPERKPATVSVYSKGKRVDSPDAKATGDKCGDPNCVSCEKGVRTCPVSGKPIYPKPTEEEAAGYAFMWVSSIATVTARATGTDFRAPQEAEIVHMRDPIRNVLWRRAGFTSAYGDLLALMGATIMLGYARVSQAWLELERVRVARQQGRVPSNGAEAVAA